MIFFSHLGLTTGIVKAGETAACSRRPMRSARIDYRYVLLGSILPDLIDKPLGMFLLRNVFHNSRLFGHTLLFSLALLAAGFWMWKRCRSNKLLTLGGCCVIHLVCDSMWAYPSILFWPLLGLAFPARPDGNWVLQDFSFLLGNAFYLGAEAAGFGILLFLFVRAWRCGRLGAFWREGRL